MKRLFIAIDINFSENDKIFIENLQKKLSSNNNKIKWVKLENIHLTLKFLGNTKENLIDKIIENLKKISSHTSSFNLDLEGIGVFKNLKKPNVIWIGVKENNQLKNLFNLINIQLENIGFSPETRDFRPHITLGRIKYINNLKILSQIILNNVEKNFTPQKIKNFHLFESILTKHGPIYKKLESFTLG